MSRSTERFRCDACGVAAHKWAGRCPSCHEWNTLAADLAPVPGAGRSDAFARAVALSGVEGDGTLAQPTGITEVDRVLGGGVVTGGVTLVFGPPGVGKSTLLFQVLASFARRGAPVLLASAEESLAQVKGRANRLGPVPDALMVLAGHDVGAIEAAIASRPPALVVVDSIQTICDPDSPGATGSLNQIRHCVDRLTRLAKSSGVPMILVGHVTKDGDLAGPRTIEHMVDTVLSFEGDRHHSLRMLTAIKHRFGATGEVGIFEMGDDGLTGVADPGELLLGDRMADVAGSVVIPVLQGRRPLLVEVQALLSPHGASPSARPRTLGIDASRASLLLAVLGCRTALGSLDAEVFVAAVGGISITEPAVDLAVALAVASAALAVAVPPDLVAFGELGLAGEVRAVPGAERRISEAQRAGFGAALVPASTPSEAFALAKGMEIHLVRTLDEALHHAFGSSARDQSDDAGRIGPERVTDAACGDTMPTWSSVAVSR